jgi:hypothetical protein
VIAPIAPIAPIARVLVRARARFRARVRVQCLALGLGLCAAAFAARAETVLVDAGGTARWLAGAADPGVGMTWTDPAFDDSSWATGTFGMGYETATSFGADALLRTTVPTDTVLLATRARFDVADPSAVATLHFGADQDDAAVAWLNGVEIWRSPDMPAGPPDWATFPSSHESSNARAPVLVPLDDVTARALPALRAGTNVLAIGVWNDDAASSDLVLVPRLVADQELAVIRGPYLQSMSATSVVLRWRTNAATDTRAWWGASPATLDQSAVEAGSTTEHAILVSGLAPGTRHHYAVGSSAGALAGGDPQHAFVTPPLAGTRLPFRAWVLGDSGTKNADAAAVRDAFDALAASESRPADLAIMLGDNAYDSGTDVEYQAAVFDMYGAQLRTAPLWATFGNHDAMNADSTTQSGVYYDAFTFPAAGECGGVPSGTEAWYSFDWANVHFVCLDSQDSDRSAGGLMMDWLRSDLAAARQDWIVAYWHHPPYTKGSHDSDTEVRHVEMRAEALPLLETAGVDLVLAGHSHSYERSYLIDGHYGLSTTFGPANVKDGGSGDEAVDGPYRKPTAGLAPHEGAVFAVAGSSGKIEDDGPLDHPAMHVSLLELGSIVLDFDGLRLRARMVDDAGAWRDAFTIVKGESDCGDGLDDDGDTLADCADADCSGRDSDGDGAGDCADCAPADPGSSASPAEIGRLDVAKPAPDSSSSVLAWNDPRAAGSGTVSDVATGSIRALRIDRSLAPGASCLAAGLAAPAFTDLRRPPPADGWWYLVRARNACAAATWGTSSDGTPRPALPCP